jgi:predicted O-linked N-acetylglucosamine transferase (SPINDLY family)
VDLSGHSAGNRLLVFARKPAPVQITAWGYAAGTGMRAMDVFFTDKVIVPPAERAFYREEVRYLPCALGSFFMDPFPEINELPALNCGHITFGSFNRLAKISEQTYSTWAQVLLQITGSRLILKTPELNERSNRERIVSYFKNAGLPVDRIVMMGGSTWFEHMTAYRSVDIALDPFPHGGGMTAMEGCMMGVPVITLNWPMLTGRLSASLMTTLGLTDWIAQTQQEYVEMAVQKAADLQSLSALRGKLRRIFLASIVGDQKAYVSRVEQEYRQLWREWCASNGEAN